MTPRRRRPDGGANNPTDNTSNHPPDGSTSGNSPSGPSGSGRRVDASPDSIEDMAGRLRNTGDRVDGVTRQVENVQLGPEAMGLLGANFTGAARSHVQVAGQNLARTRQAVQNAEDGTRATAQTYRDTDTTNATDISSIDTDTTPPRTNDPGGSTTPSSTTPAGTSATPPPSGTSPLGDPGGGTPPPNGPGGPGDPPRNTGGAGDDGGWRGENGLQLTPAQNAAANDFLDRARQAEPPITQSMQRISDGVPGSQLVGLDYRLKSDESFKRKLATAIQDNPELTMAEHLADMKDSVRYTMQVEPGNYTSGVQHAIDTLESQGYENIKFKNTWDSSGYQGINSMWRDPATGQVFELQFHTQDSFDAKMITHDLYEQARLPGVDDATRQRLNQQQADVFNNVPRPDGASDIRVGGPRRD